MAERQADVADASARELRPRLADAALAGLSTLVPTTQAAETDEALRWLRQRGASELVEWPRLRTDPHPDDRMLVRLADALVLDDAELLACVLALRVEVDALLAHAISALQGTETWRGPARPTLGLVARIARVCLGGLVEEHDQVARLLDGPALASGLLRLQQEELPAVERPVSLAPFLISALLHERSAIRACRIEAVAVTPLAADSLPLPPRWLKEVEHHVRALEHPDASKVLVLRSAAPAESLAVAALLGQRLGLDAVRIEGAVRGFRDHVPGETASASELRVAAPPALEPWLIAHRALPAFPIDMAPGDRVHPARFAHYRGPIVLACGIEGDVDASFDASPVQQWRLPIPSRAERAALWRATLGEHVMPGKQVQTCAREHRGGVASIVSLARAARQASAARGGGGRVLHDDVRGAMLADSTGFGALSGLAHRVVPSADVEALVRADGLARELDLLLSRCKARDELVSGLGAASRARYTPGVKALFHGPSGTGKSLAVHWLAWRLGKPLFRVDLAAVSSKYIGETEKNLSQLLARAEHGDGILLFDEADALFGTRTEVKQANDRFANAQTNYLLQRIESFEGVAVLTGNSKARFDDAFMRRLDAVVEFPLPNATERRALWEVHLGKHHDVDAFALARIAAEVDLPGGHIRNAVLTAALLAHARGRASRLMLADVLAGIALEYSKLGRQPPGGVAAMK
jgi:hypothetical protein